MGFGFVFVFAVSRIKMDPNYIEQQRKVMQETEQAFKRLLRAWFRSLLRVDPSVNEIILCTRELRKGCDALIHSIESQMDAVAAHVHVGIIRRS